MELFAADGHDAGGCERVTGKSGMRPVLPAMADQVGISKSEVSRETIEAGTRVLQELAERDLSELDVLVVYLDGIVFGDYHVLAAVGVDATGRKHVLGLREGPSENATVTTGLLEELVERGLRADRRRLFVIDGAKALRSAIGHVFGKGNLVQRCRNHKVRNILGHLPKAQHEQARSTLPCGVEATRRHSHTGSTAG